MNQIIFLFLNNYKNILDNYIATHLSNPDFNLDQINKYVNKQSEYES